MNGVACEAVGQRSPSASHFHGRSSIIASAQATLRQRAFDDWADGVPKGAGVTKRV